MQKRVIREGAIFALLLVTFALLMHPDLLHEPAARFSQLMGRGDYFHPFIYTALLYLITLLFRGIVRLLRRLFTKKKPSE